MFSPIVFKSLSIFAGVGIAAGGFAVLSIKTDLFKFSAKEGDGVAYVVSDTVNNVSNQVNNLNSSYFCEVDQVKDSKSSCKIYLHVANPTTKWDSLTTSKSNSDKEASVQDLQSNNKTFKIVALKSFIDSLGNGFSKKIKVISGSTTIANLDLLFAVKSGGNKIGQSQKFLAKAKTFTDQSGTSQTSLGSLSDPQNLKCLISSVANAANAKSCKVYDFSNSETGHNASSTADALNYATSPTNTSTTITQHKHYVVEFNSANDAFDISNLGSNKLFLHVMSSSDNNKEVTTGVKQIEFTPIHPLFNSPDTNKSALIVK